MARPWQWFRVPKAGERRPWHSPQQAMRESAELQARSEGREIGAAELEAAAFNLQAHNGICAGRYADWERDDA